MPQSHPHITCLYWSRLAQNFDALTGQGANTLTTAHDSNGNVKELQLFNERIRHLRFVRC